MKEIEIVKKYSNRDDIEILHLVESGSQICGWNSANSDYDFRGVYLDPLNKVLSLHPGRDNIVNVSDEYDFQLYELKKFLSLLVKGNFNAMEMIYSPMVYHSDENFKKELEYLADLCMCKGIGRHAYGWSYSIYKMDWNKPKKCLMALRPMMVFLYYQIHGRWEPDISKLAHEFNPKLQNLISTLIELKQKGMKTPKNVKDLTNKLHGDLKEQLDNFLEQSDLRDKPDKRAFDIANNMLIRYRMRLDEESEHYYHLADGFVNGCKYCDEERP